MAKTTRRSALLACTTALAAALAALPAAAAFRTRWTPAARWAGPCTIIGAVAEPESSLISKRMTAGMKATEARGRHLGRPGTPQRVVNGTEAPATFTDLRIRTIQRRIAGRASTAATGAAA